MRIVVNSQFFHDPEAWEHLANERIPLLLRQKPRLRAWSAGCFTGKEAYSLAMLLAESQPDGEWSILATDNDPSVLEATRRRGPFNARDLENVPAAWKARHLEAGLPAQGLAYVQPHLGERMEIVQHDLRHDPFPAEMDLILFRNLEPCFSAEQYLAIWRRFAKTLRPGGILFVGALDRAPPLLQPDFERLRSCFYQRL